MDSPQYMIRRSLCMKDLSFKPYYKWIVLNTIKYTNVLTTNTPKF